MGCETETQKTGQRRGKGGTVNQQLLGEDMEKSTAGKNEGQKQGKGRRD
jgi:hypothetical protein